MGIDFLVVEKINENYAFCEDSNKEIAKIPLFKLYDGVKINDCIVIKNEKFIYDDDLTKKRKSDAIRLSKLLFED